MCLKSSRNQHGELDGSHHSPMTPWGKLRLNWVNSSGQIVYNSQGNRVIHIANALFTVHPPTYQHPNPRPDMHGLGFVHRIHNTYYDCYLSK